MVISRIMLVPRNAGDGRASGQVTAVHGSVVDVKFPAGILPAVDEGITIERCERRQLIAEVHQHLDPVTVRAVALESTAGLSRGAQARATGAPIRVPVGNAVLGRLLNVTLSPPIAGRRFPPTSSSGPCTRQPLQSIA